MEEHSTNTLFKLFLRVNHKLSSINVRRRSHSQKARGISSHLRKDIGLEVERNDGRDFSRFL